jgi:hypothetical protein
MVFSDHRVSFNSFVDILLMISEEKMRGIDAERRIARMQNPEPIRDGAICKLIGIAMSANALAFQPEASIAIRKGSGLP